MARFATDPKISTQLGRREAPCLGKCYKVFFSVIKSISFHGIKAILM